MNDRILMLFAGTTEGRNLCEYLADSRYITHVYVTTEYGRELLPESDNLFIHVGKLDENQIYDELKRIQPDIVIDATHPYAWQITHNVREACKNVPARYIRILREPANENNDFEEYESVIYTDTVKEAVNILNSTRFVKDNILLTTGSKNIPEYKNIINYKERAYLRLLPSPEMLGKAIDAGFAQSHLIGMQGPFSEEFNEALIRLLHIDVLVTKDSGSKGGYEEKLEAALNAGIKTIVIRRPVEEEGKSLYEVMEYLKTI